MNDLNIILGQGLGLIKFGMSQNEVLTLLGKTDKEYKTDYNCIRWQYNSLMIELSFEPENNYSLGWIETYSLETLLFGRKLIGLKRKDIFKFIGKYLKEEVEIEDYGSFISINYSKNWLELQFQFDYLHNINFGRLQYKSLSKLTQHKGNKKILEEYVKVGRDQALHFKPNKSEKAIKTNIVFIPKRGIKDAREKIQKSIKEVSKIF